MKIKRLPFLLLMLFALFLFASCGNKKDADENKSGTINETIDEVEPDVEEKETTYKVLHFLEKLENNEYKCDTEEEIPAVSNHPTEAAPKTYEGFTAKEFKQKKIMPDGSTEIKIYYDRNRFNVSVNNFNKGTTTGAGTYKYGQQVTLNATPNTGFNFLGWYVNDHLVENNSEYKFTIALSDVSVEARFEAKDIEYTVNHYQQNLNDDGYTIVTNDTRVLSGKAFDDTNATANNYEGFSVKPLEQKEINPNGSTVINIYYERDKHTISISNSNPSMGSATGAGTYKYGQTVTLTATPGDGVEIDGWYVNGINIWDECEYSFVVGTENISFNVKFKYKTINYSVEHYQQNLNDDNYTIVSNDTQILSGPAFSQTQAEANDYTGFSAKAFEQKEINPNGETVVKIYYERDKHSVAITNSNPEMGSATGAGTYKYGQTVTLTATTGDEYLIDGWYVNDVSKGNSTEYAFVMGTNDVTVEIRFNYKSVNYKVEHYQENANDDGYTIVSKDTETKTGTPNTLTQATAKSYTGFNKPTTISQETINADGTTVVKIYYNRIKYQLNISYNDSKAGTVSGAGTYKYGQTVTISATPNEGYGFGGWASSSIYVNIIDRTNPKQVTITTTNTYYAKFILNAHDINLNVTGTSTNNVSIVGETSNSQGYYGKTYTVVVNDKNIVSMKLNSGTAVLTKSLTFTMPNDDVTIYINVSTYVREDNKIYFGFYPQTEIKSSTNAALVAELNTLCGSARPSASNLNGWVDYKYYISSSVTSYMYYKDVQYNGDYYRAVYFTQYRPYVITLSSTQGNSFQDENGYNTNNVYWFKFDPIKWIILEENSTQALIYADLILDAKDYYFDSNSGKTNHYYKGYLLGNGYSNNYELSTIRKFLANDFAIKFSSDQIGLFVTTTVDNSADSTHSGSNPYYSNNTSDEIFLLSHREINTYLNSPQLRTTTATDYANSQGFNGFYWLRSPYLQSGNHVEAITAAGEFSATYNTHTRCGVRPACWIRL